MTQTFVTDFEKCHISGCFCHSGGCAGSVPIPQHQARLLQGPMEFSRVVTRDSLAGACAVVRGSMFEWRGLRGALGRQAAISAKEPWWMTRRSDPTELERVISTTLGLLGRWRLWRLWPMAVAVSQSL